MKSGDRIPGDKLLCETSSNGMLRWMAGVGRTLKEYRQTKYPKYCRGWLSGITRAIEIERQLPKMETLNHLLQPMNFGRDQHDQWAQDQHDRLDEDQIRELLDRLENRAIEESRHMNLHYERYPYEYPAQGQQLHARPAYRPDPGDDIRIPASNTTTEVPITLFSSDRYATHILDLTLGNTHPQVALRAQDAYERAAAQRRKKSHLPADRIVEIAVENKLFCHFSDGPRGEIWVILAGREDILAALEEFPDFTGGRWHLLGVGRGGSEGLLYMLRPRYDRAMMEIEDEDNQMMSKGEKMAELEE